jgi:hypothetical protein
MNHLFCQFSVPIVVLLASLHSFPAAAESTCGCEDIPDIRNRLCITRAAIAEYDRLIQRARDQEKQTGKPIFVTKSDKENLIKPCVQEVMVAMNVPGSRQAKAETDDACDVTVTRADTACLGKAVEIHEGRHALVCQWMREKESSRGLIAEFLMNFKDTRSGQSAIGYMNEEKSGYQGEINFLRSELMSLSARCPRGMFEIETKDPSGNTRREFTIEFCPPPKPRPPVDKSACQAR